MDFFNELKKLDKELKNRFNITFLFGDNTWYKIQRYSHLLSNEDKLHYFYWLRTLSTYYPFNQLFNEHEIFEEYLDAEHGAAFSKRFLMPMDDDPKIIMQPEEKRITTTKVKSPEPILWLGTKEQFAAMINVLMESGMITNEKKYEKFKNHFKPVDNSDWGDLSGKAVKLFVSEKDGKPRKKVKALETALKIAIPRKPTS